MKKLISILAVVALALSANAQTAKDLAKERMELNSIYKKMLDAKPTKEAKKEAKQYKKAGWMAPAGERSLEQQFTTSYFLSQEETIDENGNAVPRFLSHSSQSVAGTYNVAFAAARTAALTEISSLIKSELVAAVKSKADNAQANALDATTVDKFHQRVASIVDQSITNARPVSTMYRILPNNNYEVMIRLVVDRKEVARNIKENLRKQLEEEGDEFNGIVDQALQNL